MTRTSFFQSKPTDTCTKMAINGCNVVRSPSTIAQATRTFIGMMLTGGILNWCISYKIYFWCLSLVKDADKELDEEINLPTIEGKIQLADFDQNIPIKLIDLKGPLPEFVVTIATHIANQSPNYCFYIPLICGMCMTLILSISITAMMMSCHIALSQKKSELTLEVPDDYLLLEQEERKEQESDRTRLCACA